MLTDFICFMLSTLLNLQSSLRTAGVSRTTSNARCSFQFVYGFNRSGENLDHPNVRPSPSANLRGLSRFGLYFWSPWSTRAETHHACILVNGVTPKMFDRDTQATSSALASLTLDSPFTCFIRRFTSLLHPIPSSNESASIHKGCDCLPANTPHLLPYCERFSRKNQVFYSQFRVSRSVS